MPPEQTPAPELKLVVPPRPQKPAPDGDDDGSDHAEQHVGHKRMMNDPTMRALLGTPTNPLLGWASVRECHPSGLRRSVALTGVARQHRRSV